MLSLLDDLTIDLARSFHERCLAWNIVYRRYRGKGLIEPHSAGMHFSILDLLPSSVSWVARRRGEVVGTMSAVVYTTAGLPSGEIYEDDLRALGIDGQVICELTKLATYDDANSNTIATLLSYYLIHWCQCLKVDDLFCVVHPRHAQVWTRLHGWSVVSNVKSHPGVNNNPGVLLHLDIKELRHHPELVRARGQRVLRELEDSDLAAQSPLRLSGSEVALLLIQKPEILLQGSKSHRLAFERHYPWAHGLISPLLYATKNDWVNCVSLPTARPKRDRPFRFASSVTQVEAELQNLKRIREQDRLFKLESPLILLVDDGQPWRDTIRTLLEDIGFVVVRVSELSQALQLIGESLFDLIIIADRLSADALWTLSLAIREQDAVWRSHTPVINLTAFVEAEHAGSLSFASQDQAELELRSAREVLRALRVVSVWEELVEELPKEANEKAVGCC